MMTSDLKKRLIDKIRKTDDTAILEEVYRWLEMETEEEVYKLSDEQRKVIRKAREQIKSGNYLTDDQANKDIDEWLNK